MSLYFSHHSSARGREFREGKEKCFLTNRESFRFWWARPFPSPLVEMSEIDYNLPVARPIALRTSGQHPAHPKPHADTAEYERLYKESIEHPTQFWDRVSPSPPSPASFLPSFLASKLLEIHLRTLWGSSRLPSRSLEELG